MNPRIRYKWTAEMYAQAMNLRQNGETYTNIAIKVGVTPESVAHKFNAEYAARPKAETSKRHCRRCRQPVYLTTHQIWCQSCRTILTSYDSPFAL